MQESYERYCADWAMRQRLAGETAFELFLGEALEGQHTKPLPDGYAYYGGMSSLPQPLGGQAYAEANSAAAEAREAFAQREPRKSFDVFEKRWKKGRR